jgi:hypothetical protein
VTINVLNVIANNLWIKFINHNFQQFLFNPKKIIIHEKIQGLALKIEFSYIIKSVLYQNCFYIIN